MSCVRFILNAVFSLACCGQVLFAEAPATPDAQTPPAGIRTSEGPWGKLEYYNVVLEPPSSHLWSSLYSNRSVWKFGQRSSGEVLQLLEELKVSPELLDLVRREGKWQSKTSGTELELSDSMIENTKPEDRTILSAWFFANNGEFFSHLIINLEGHDYSAFHGRVSDETLNLVRTLTFPRGKVLSMMDLAYVMRKLGNDEAEKEKFLRALFSTRGLIVRLVVDETTDLDSVVSYWSRGDVNPGVRSILEQVRLTEGVDKIDIVHLLPPLPRRYLFGFTNLQDVGPKNTPDCFWASLQFFKRSPSPRMLDGLSLFYYLDFDFEEVAGELQFGDIVCMFDRKEGIFIHSYVHISDEIVFTKNGASFARPFILGLKSDMLSVYLDETEYIFRTFRRKAGT